MFQWNILTFEHKTKPETDSNCRKVIEKKTVKPHSFITATHCMALSGVREYMSDAGLR